MQEQDKLALLHITNNERIIMEPLADYYLTKALDYLDKYLLNGLQYDLDQANSYYLDFLKLN
jgi:hypothetical protein